MKIRTSHARARDDAVLSYKASSGTIYEGCIKADLVTKTLYGFVLHINDTIHYTGSDIAELEASFKEGVEDYIATCGELGKEPEQPFKGTFNVRTTPELHAWAALQAKTHGVSLNEIVNRALAQFRISLEVRVTERLMSVERLGAPISVQESTERIAQTTSSTWWDALAIAGDEVAETAVPSISPSRGLLVSLKSSRPKLN